MEGTLFNFWLITRYFYCHSIHLTISISLLQKGKYCGCVFLLSFNGFALEIWVLNDGWEFALLIIYYIIRDIPRICKTSPQDNVYGKFTYPGAFLKCSRMFLLHLFCFKESISVDKMSFNQVPRLPFQLIYTWRESFYSRAFGTILLSHLKILMFYNTMYTVLYKFTSRATLSAKGLKKNL